MEDWRVMALQKHRGEADNSVWVGRHSALTHLVVVCFCMLPVVSTTRAEREPKYMHILCKWFEVKWVFDVGVWMRTSHTSISVFWAEYTLFFFRLKVTPSTVLVYCLYMKATYWLFIYHALRLKTCFQLTVHSTVTLQSAQGTVMQCSLLTVKHALYWVSL